MKRFLAITLCILLLTLCACQPTPDEEYVVNKGDNKAEEIINQTALPTAAPKTTETGKSPEPTEADLSSPWKDASGQTIFPERWEEEHIINDYKEMIISADVMTSGMESYPVQLVREGKFTSEDLMKAAEYLFQGKQVTGWLKGTYTTRERLMEAIQRVAVSDMPEADKNDQLEALNYELSGRTISDADMTTCSDIKEVPVGGNGVTVYTEDGGGYMRFSENDIWVSMPLNGVVRPKSAVLGIEREQQNYTAEISLDEATARAEEFLAAMGIDGFSLYFSDEAQCTNDLTTEVISTGWQLRYIRSYGYCPFSVSQYDRSVEGPFNFDNKWGRDVTSYSRPVREETIVLYVTGSGIGSFAMSNPYESVGTANENVQLYDFDELTKKIRLLFGATINDPYECEGYYVIEEMILTVVPTPKKDSSYYYMMPVWVCKIGEYVSVSDGLGLSHFYIPGKQVFENWNTVAFNAIDGTRVSLPVG